MNSSEPKTRNSGYMLVVTRKIGMSVAWESERTLPVTTTVCEMYSDSISLWASLPVDEADRGRAAFRLLS